MFRFVKDSMQSGWKRDEKSCRNILADLNSSAIVAKIPTETIATSHFLRLFPGSISIGTPLQRSYACVRAFVRDRILVRLFSLSLFHFHSLAPCRRLAVFLFALRVVPWYPALFCSFILAAHNLPWARIIPPVPPLRAARQPNRPFSSRNLSRQLFAMLPRQFAYLGRLNLKTARNAREPVRLDRS